MRTKEDYIRAILLFLGGIFLFSFAISPFIWMVWISFMKNPFFLYNLEDNTYLGVTNLTAEMGDGQVTLDWKDPEDKNFKHIELSYTFRPRDLPPIIIEKGVEHYTVKDLDNGRKYTFILKPIRHEEGEEDDLTLQSTKAISGSPQTPTGNHIEVSNITAERGNRIVNLKWKNPTDEVDGINIRYYAYGKTDYEPIKLEGNKNTFTIEELTNDNKYTFIVSTIDEEGSISPGVSISKTPKEPPIIFTLENYILLLTDKSLRFGNYFWNSIIVSIITSLVVSLISSLAGYAVSRMRFPGRIAIPLFILAMSMFPQISIVGYLLKLFSNIGLFNTYAALVFPYIAWTVPIALWINMSYFSQIPVDLDKAALVDGAGRLKIIFRIVLPVALPGIFSSLLLVFIACFNEFLFAITLTSDWTAQTLPIVIARFEGFHGKVAWGPTMAASAIAAVPLVILTLIFQRYVVQGLVGGAVKG